ncbi:MAG: potassium/proton antiporter [Candidatus Omnitrophica bacterium]|nr:potassium/proton antiporter [Candidatus Omnitrophota bacterium]
MHVPLEIFLLWASGLTLLSVVVSKVSDRFAVPALLLFLLVGIIAGSEGLGGIYFDNYHIAKSVGIIALIFIIFLGGIETEWKSVRPVLAPGMLLSTVGVLITALTVGICTTVLLNFTLVEGLLMGAIVSSTDAAAVFSILRSKKISLKGNLKPLLELESGSNDPMAVFLTASLLGVISRAQTTFLAMAVSFALNLGIGLLLGYVMARFSVAAVNRIKLEHEGLYPVLTISLVLLTYALTTLAQGNGFLAVYLLGLEMSRRDFAYKKTLARFHAGVAWLMQIIMFLTLGLLVFPSQVLSVFGSGMFIAAILIFVARPLGVIVCLLPFRFLWQEHVMISWVGLRGAVPIILATFPLLAGIPQAHIMFDIVFFVVVTSVVLQGTSIPFVARLLRVQAPLDVKKRFPIEIEQSEGMDATLTDLIVPYESAVVGKRIVELGLPAKALIVLISRADKFIVPNGSTLLEGGDILQVLADEPDLKKFQSLLAVIKPEALTLD